MNLISKCICIVMTGGMCCVAYAAPEPVTELKTPQDKVNYAIGVNIANSFKQQDVEVNLDLVIQGLRDGYGDGELLLSSQELRKATVQHQTNVRKKFGSRARATLSDGNKKASETFLTNNRKKDGVVVLPSGMQYIVVKDGHGKKPVDGSSVAYRFSGTLINGKEFDGTSRTGEPKPISIKDIAPEGLREGLKLMSVGSRWQFFLPPQLGYGELGFGQAVGPNQVVIYDVELLAVN